MNANCTVAAHIKFACICIILGILCWVTKSTRPGSPKIFRARCCTHGSSAFITRALANGSTLKLRCLMILIGRSQQAGCKGKRKRNRHSRINVGNDAKTHCTPKALHAISHRSGVSFAQAFRSARRLTQLFVSRLLVFNTLRHHRARQHRLHDFAALIRRYVA